MCECSLGGRESGMNAKSRDLCTGSDWTPTGEVGVFVQLPIVNDV